MKKVILFFLLCITSTYGQISGCTDTLAENFNPNATVDNGSCIFPDPVITAPNVITPNDDGRNDAFRMNCANSFPLKVHTMYMKKPNK